MILSLSNEAKPVQHWIIELLHTHTSTAFSLTKSAVVLKST